MEEKDKDIPTVKEDQGEYKVGNCNPPKEHQFKPGCSGNPNGRTPGWRAILNKAAEQHYTADKIIKVLEAMYNCALKGDVKAQKHWLDRGLGKITDKVDITSQGENITFTFTPAGAKKDIGDNGI